MFSIFCHHKFLFQKLPICISRTFFSVSKFPIHTAWRSKRLITFFFRPFLILFERSSLLLRNAFLTIEILFLISFVKIQSFEISYHNQRNWFTCLTTCLFIVMLTAFLLYFTPALQVLITEEKSNFRSIGSVGSIGSILSFERWFKLKILKCKNV